MIYFSKFFFFFECQSGAIIGDGDRKRGVHAKPSKKTNVQFLAKIAPPSGRSEEISEIKPKKIWTPF